MLGHNSYNHNVFVGESFDVDCRHEHSSHGQLSEIQLFGECETNLQILLLCR